MLLCYLLLLQAAWRTYAYWPGSPPDGFSEWTTTEWTTTLAPTPKFTPMWSKCSAVEVTITVTQTILQTSSAVTITDTSTIESGIALNTSNTVTPSALKPRHYEIQASSWNIPSIVPTPETVSITASEVLTDWNFCSTSTLTTTLIEYTTLTLPASTAIATAFETIPGMQVNEPTLFPTALRFLTTSS